MIATSNWFCSSVLPTGDIVALVVNCSISTSLQIEETEFPGDEL